jgi:hypothetical protein
VVESAIVRIVCPGCDGRRYKTIERRWVVSGMTGPRSIIFLSLQKVKVRVRPRDSPTRFTQIGIVLLSRPYHHVKTG